MDDTSLVEMLAAGATHAEMAAACNTSQREIRRRLNRLGENRHTVREKAETDYVIGEVEFLLSFGEKPQRIADGIMCHRPGRSVRPYTVNSLIALCRRHDRHDLADKLMVKPRPRVEVSA